MQLGPIRTCRGDNCSKPMVWVIMESGKKNPVDFVPSDKGNILVEVADDGKTINGRTLKGDELYRAKQEGVKLRTSHFATCPDSKAFKK